MRFIPSLTFDNTPCLSAEWAGHSYEILFDEDLFHLRMKTAGRKKWRDMGRFRSLEKALALADILAENVTWSEALISEVNESIRKVAQRTTIDLATMMVLLTKSGIISKEDWRLTRMRVTAISDQLGAQERDLFDELDGS